MDQKAAQSFFDHICRNGGPLSREGDLSELYTAMKATANPTASAAELQVLLQQATEAARGFELQSKQKTARIDRLTGELTEKKDQLKQLRERLTQLRKHGKRPSMYCTATVNDEMDQPAITVRSLFAAALELAWEDGEHYGDMAIWLDRPDEFYFATRIHRRARGDLIIEAKELTDAAMSRKRRSALTLKTLLKWMREFPAPAEWDRQCVYFDCGDGLWSATGEIIPTGDQASFLVQRCTSLPTAE